MVRARLGVVALVACHAASAPPRPAPSPAPPALPAPPSPITVAYRRIASEFEIMDNVVQWLPDKNEIEYRTWWEERSPLTPKDTALFARYVELRRKHYPAAGAPRGVFPAEKPVDVVARAFYEAETLDDAAVRMHGSIPTDDLAFFRDFYAQYEPRLSELHLLQESADLAAFARITNEALSGAGPFARDIARAYGQSEVPRFTALFVWWPPEEHVTANARGDILLLKYNPKRHGEDAAHATDVVMHELAHVVSSRRPAAEREELSSVFSRGCATDRLKPLQALEEPLAVVMQKRYLRATDPARLDWTRTWYGDPWISNYAKLLFPVFDAHPVVDATFMKSAAKVCAQLQALER